jgi:hypothetical protein
MNEISREEADAKLQALEHKILAQFGMLGARFDGLKERLDDLGRQFDRLWQMQWGTLGAIVVAVLVNHFWHA